jgi:hypothetical protein
MEIFGSKINALLSRAAARDLHDVANMIHYGIFDESEEDLLRKCVVFYAAVSARNINKTFDTGALDQLTKHRIRTDLFSVIRNKDALDLDSTKKVVRNYIDDLIKLTESEAEFLDRFENTEYRPELLFQQEEVVARLSQHPMAVWKMQTK